MLDIKDYLLEYERKVPNILLLWSGIVVFIIIFILIINSAFKIKNYYQVEGIIKDNNLNILVPLEKTKEIIKNKAVYIDDEKYKYEVIKIDSNITEIEKNYYQSIALDIKLKDKYFVNNNIVKVQFIIEEMTILEYIYNLFKGGF